MDGSPPSSNVKKSRRIAYILFEQWDPLGVKDVAPANEYDEYAREIEMMLDRGEGGRQIRAYLHNKRRDVLLMPEDRSADGRIARAIIAMMRGAAVIARDG